MHTTTTIEALDGPVRASNTYRLLDLLTRPPARRKYHFQQISASEGEKFWLNSNSTHFEIIKRKREYKTRIYYGKFSYLLPLHSKLSEQR